jgi:hypothetical protein
MNADGHLAFHGLIAIHFRPKCPFFKCDQGLLRQLTMRSRLKDDDGHVSVFADEKPVLEPIIELFPFQLTGNGWLGGLLRNWAELLILIQAQPMGMNHGKRFNLRIFFVIGSISRNV